jgi:hypothetical protein
LRGAAVDCGEIAARLWLCVFSAICCAVAQNGACGRNGPGGRRPEARREPGRRRIDERPAGGEHFAHRTDRPRPRLRARAIGARRARELNVDRPEHGN